ncbi:hypothetical protein [Foetidibacter luteolus]|uniref:hypothetical protein n=1 Tax=Foetidibacter luteolus TaxID=2608880 RepID=UPI00129B1AB9|nr:hypothetical protein [Foetidibacter luteolus]
MNIRKELLHAKRQTKELAMAVATFAISEADNFRELMDCFLSNDYRLAQRAAWCVSRAVRDQPSMITPHLNTLVKQLDKTGVHPAVIRNTVRILKAIEIPEAFHGQVMNACFRLIESPSTPAAIKAFSLTILFNLAKIYTEIKEELKLIINSVYETETPAFKARARKILPYL